MRSCVAVVLVLAWGGCGASKGSRATGVTAPGSRDALRQAGRVSGPGAGVATGDFSGWEGWTQVSKRRFLSLGHGSIWVDINVDPGHVESYERGAAQVPVGFRVAKAGYEQDGTFLAVTAMQKMPPGYDPEHGDWYYLVVFRDGRTATMQGPLEACRSCHERALARDYLFGITTE